ncbi:MAG: hypothetical protein ACKVWV_08555 [Planctomycetota bacterium]
MVGYIRHGSQTQTSEYYNVVGGPIVFDALSQTSNAVYELDVYAQSTSEALDIARQALTSSVGDPIDPRIAIKTWLRANVTAEGGRLIGIAQGPFTQFRVEWNGVPSYSDLAVGQNAVQSQLPGGLWIVEAAVLLSDVHAPGQWNTASVNLHHRNVNGMQHASMGMRVTD